MRLATTKWHPLVRLIVWCWNHLTTKDKVDLTCHFIQYVQQNMDCRGVVYISCSECPGGLGPREGIRALGLPKRTN